MKKAFVLSSLIALLILITSFIKNLNSIPNQKSPTVQTPPCSYPLTYYDFHYRKETDNPSIIMLGNSLVRHAKWDSLLNRKDVINRGISGDNLRCMCERLSYLKNSSAKICFIEGGINDLPGKTADTLFKYYQQIVLFWLGEKKIPVINLVLYISPKAGDKWEHRKDYKGINTTIRELNSKLKNFAIENKIDYIDLNRTLSDEVNLTLRDSFTTDGVHLTPAAYKIWSDEISAVLKRKGI